MAPHAIQHLDSKVPGRNPHMHVTTAGDHVGCNLGEPLLEAPVADIVGESGKSRYAEGWGAGRHQAGAPLRGNLSHRAPFG
jgi:hypothetical protein